MSPAPPATSAESNNPSWGFSAAAAVLRSPNDEVRRHWLHTNNSPKKRADGTQVITTNLQMRKNHPLERFQIVRTRSLVHEAPNIVWTDVLRQLSECNRSPSNHTQRAEGHEFGIAKVYRISSAR